MEKKQMRNAAMLMMALISVMAVAAGASADPIRFDNPMGDGHFAWAPGTSTGEHYLDVTQPAAQQLDVATTSTLGQIVDEVSVLVAGTGTAGALQVHVGGLYGAFIEGADEQTQIPTVSSWADYGYVFHESFPEEVPLPMNQPTYLGIRFEMSSSIHYGWIGVVMDDEHQLDAFAWGYETEPGMSIAAGAGLPEPGTALLLAVGCAGLLQRRRRPATGV